MQGFTQNVSIKTPTEERKYESQKKAPSSTSTANFLLVQSTPQELEALESNIKKLEADLHEAKSRNIYLTNLVDSQKR